MSPSDYSKFGSFFDKVIRDYHGDESGEKKHITDWNVEGADYDVKKLGQDELSMRVRVGRNLLGFSLPGDMDKKERIEFEQKMLPAFDSLKKSYGGQVYSLTPDFGDQGLNNPNLIDKEEYQKLVDAHVMFKDMDADPYLKSAGKKSLFISSIFLSTYIVHTLTVTSFQYPSYIHSALPKVSVLIGLMDVAVGSRRIRCVSFGLERKINYVSCKYK